MTVASDKEQTSIIIEASFSAGFNDCRQKVQAVLDEAMSWPIPQKLKPAERRREIVRRIVIEVARLKP
jgi:hypothetical protein